METLAGPYLTHCKHLRKRVCSQVSTAETFFVLSNDRNSVEVVSMSTTAQTCSAFEPTAQPVPSEGHPQAWAS